MVHAKYSALIILVILLSLPVSAAALQKAELFPGLKGETLSGAAFDLQSFKGQPIVLKIGTTWCGTCRLQSKTMNSLHDFMAENGIHFVDVFVSETRSKVEKYFNDNGYQLPETVILDDGDIADQLNIYLIPRIILIDSDFKVYRDGDTISEKDLKDKLQQLLVTTAEEAVTN